MSTLLQRRDCFWMALGACAAAQASAATLVAVDSQNPPFMHQRGKGPALGVYPVLLRAVFQHLGRPVQLLPMPWVRALSGLDRAEHAVGGLYANQERLAKFDFGQPLMVETVRVYIRRGRLKHFDGLADLKGMRVGVLRGWTYGDEFDAARRAGDFSVEAVTSDAQNFGKLEREYLDAVIAVEQTGEAVMEGGEYPSVRAMPNPLTENPTFVAFHKSVGQRELLAKIDTVIRDMRKSGEHARLVSRGLRE